MVKRKKTRPVVFFDFDNTITMGDVLDDMLARFSINDRWKELERKWKNGTIGSRECLKGQIDGIRISKEELDRYLTDIKIDPYFKVLLKYLRARRVKAIILSDNFDYILKTILRKKNIKSPPVYSNSIKLDNNRMRPFFPFSNKRCGDCGNCKKTILDASIDKDSSAFYVGDGKSDVCAAQGADLVFAKSYLRDYFKTRRLGHVPIKNLKDVYLHLKKHMG